ncbi:MAG TPA: hypothetical protein VGO50_16435 [Pyrinomonadaceae bacterium]|jgi:hypothetical protein|nr:hypothetical protein [Pyrinomonadaceae bacterium]
MSDTFVSCVSCFSWQDSGINHEKHEKHEGYLMPGFEIEEIKAKAPEIQQN